MALHEHQQHYGAGPSSSLDKPTAMKRATESYESFSTKHPIRRRKVKKGETTTVMSTPMLKPATGIYSTKDPKAFTLPPKELYRKAALPMSNPHPVPSTMVYGKDQHVFDGIVGPQQGGVFGPVPLPGGLEQTVNPAGGTFTGSVVPQTLLPPPPKIPLLPPPTTTPLLGPSSGGGGSSSLSSPPPAHSDLDEVD